MKSSFNGKYYTRAIKLTLEEHIDLVFLPNHSTKEEVDMLSGRGVGMDAEKNAIEI